MSQLNRYTFEFHLYEKDRSVSLTISYRTKPVTAKRASELFRAEKTKLDLQKDDYVFAIKRGDEYVSYRSLR